MNKMITCFQIKPSDNTAVLLDDVEPNTNIKVIGSTSLNQLTTAEAITYGHKIALTDIPLNGEVIKYGIRIGHAIQPIKVGAWIHLHNLASDYDERSSSLDNETGAPTDTIYE